MDIPIKRHLTVVALCLAGCASHVLAQLPPLPAAVSNNAVAIVKSGKHDGWYSFMGIGAKKTWDSITTSAYVLEAGSTKWNELRSVPGPAGRLGASAVAARGQILLLGGYTVDGQGGEITVSDVSVYEPSGRKWYRGTDLPVAVHDAVVGVYRDRYVYVVGGGSKSEPTAKVQVYDIEKNKWQEATAMPGPPVFGHAGGLVDDTIVYVDGARKNTGQGPAYIASDECWLGKIDHKDITKIQWTKLPEHPGSAHFRIAAGVSDKEHKLYFAGGSETPYDFNGVGYDAHPAEPSPLVFAYDMRGGQWETVTDDMTDPTMDHRGLLVTKEGLVLLGGMEKGQKVSDSVKLIPRKAAQ